MSWHYQKNNNNKRKNSLIELKIIHHIILGKYKLSHLILWVIDWLEEFIITNWTITLQIPTSQIIEEKLIISNFKSILMKIEKKIVKNLYDHDILFRYLDIQRINDNILILWPYVNLIVTDSCKAMWSPNWYNVNNEKCHIDIDQDKFVPSNFTWMNIYSKFEMVSLGCLQLLLWQIIILYFQKCWNFQKKSSKGGGILWRKLDTIVPW